MLIWKKFIKKENLDFLPRILSAILAELAMVAGYFLFELALYGFGGATLALVGNLTQGVCATMCAVIIISILYPMKGTKNLFPMLK